MHPKKGRSTKSLRRAPAANAKSLRRGLLSASQHCGAATLPTAPPYALAGRPDPSAQTVVSKRSCAVTMATVRDVTITPEACSYLATTLGLRSAPRTMRECVFALDVAAIHVVTRAAHERARVLLLRSSFLARSCRARLTSRLEVIAIGVHAQRADKL